MKTQKLEISGIPALLYGEESRKVYLYVHGKNGSAAEAARFARTACPAGWQVLAVDLPEHGTRKNSPEKLVPWVVTRELQTVYARMQPVWKHIRVYGVSIGAWFAMQALQTQKPEKALLVSPVVDMEKLILALMQQAGVTEEQLHAAGEIPTDFGKTLSWPYLCWVREHPLHWKVPTQVLYADTDPLTGHTAMERFRQQTGAHLTILEGGEHWFHTEEQMQFLNHIGLGLRSLDAHIAHILQFAVLCSRQSNDLHSLSVCGCRRKQHIFTVTTGGNAKEHIPRFTVTIDLLCEAE